MNESAFEDERCIFATLLTLVILFVLYGKKIKELTILMFLSYEFIIDFPTSTVIMYDGSPASLSGKVNQQLFELLVVMYLKYCKR